MLKITTMRLFGLIVAIAGASASAESTGDFNAAALTEKLSDIQQESQTVGFAISIIDDGELIYAQGFGEKALGGGDPITTKSVFHWASVSKPLVATGIMQLAERGKLDIDTKLVDVLPGYVVTEPKQKEITIRQILLHTSGMPDVEDYGWDKPEFDDGALQRWALKDSPRALLFEPGTERKYSNVGFEVLGAVIERVSGKSFEQYMANNIFAPLKMNNTTFIYPDVPPSRRTQGHSGDPGAKTAVDDYPYNRRHAPSSTLNTNVEDMARYALALMNGGALDGVRILETETLADMWAPRWTIREDPYSAATMGWVHADQNGQRMLRHFGWDDGFRSALLIMPDEGQAILFVTNDEGAPFSPLLRAALAALTGDGE